MALIRCLSYLVLFSAFLSMMLPKSTSEPNYLYSDCPITKVFAPNSKYQANLNTLLHSLSSNATTKGFYSSSSNNVVYGLYLCRGDMNTTGCSACVSKATTTDLPKTYCSNRKVAIIWYDECMVRYSNHPIAGKMETSPSLALWNIVNTTGSLTGFSGVLNKTMQDVVAHAASDESNERFAASAVSITAGGSKMRLYALGQCTPDLNTSSCNLCFAKAVKVLPLSNGGRVLQPSCNIRYELYQFFSLSSIALVPAQAPAVIAPSPFASPPAPVSAEAPQPVLPVSTPTPTPVPVPVPVPSTGISTAMTGDATPAPSPVLNTSDKTNPRHLNFFGGLGIFILLKIYYYVF